MPFSRQFFAEFDKIVDLAVKDQPERAVFVCHRLETVGRQVDDGEPPVDKPGASADMRALAIGPPVSEPLRHGCKESAFRPAAFKAVLSCDPAHSFNLWSVED
jgi:hypothetical protein